jgi:translation initiation factor IF-3
MKVRVKLRFRGRQKAHKEIGFQVVNEFIQGVAAYGRADAPPKMLGDRDLNAVISPLPRNKRAKNPSESSAGDSPSPRAEAPPTRAALPNEQPAEARPRAEAFNPLPLE